MKEALVQAIVLEVRRRLIQENMMKIQSCVDKLNLDQIWYRPNENCLSIGNTLLHLNGNVRQYILSGLFGKPDSRQRSLEFSSQNKLHKDELMQPLYATMKEVDELIVKVDYNNLTDTRPVQCFDESGAGILIHVTEHFSYHVGQVAYITKMINGQSLGFYDELDLEKKDGT